MSTIGPAIDALKSGARIRRACWDVRSWFALEGDRIMLYSLGQPSGGAFVVPDDLVADDWVILDPVSGQDERVD